jgi:hypothetical protein
MDALAIVLTKHAIDRFRTRHASHLTEAEARSTLARLVPRASRLPEKSVHGQDQWLVDEPGTSRFVFLTKSDPKVGLVVVTVLTESMQAPTAAEMDDVAAAAVRLAPSFVTPLAPLTGQITPWAKRQEAHAALMREHQAAKAKRKEERRAAEVLAVAAKEETAKRRAAAKKLEKKQSKANLKPAAPIGPAPRVVSVERAERLQSHARRMEFECNYARHAARLALRALRPLIHTDPVAAAAWAEIGALKPSFLTDGFIDHEASLKPAAEVP